MLWPYGHYKLLVLSVRGPTLEPLEPDVYRRPILTSKAGPRAERVNCYWSV